MSKKPETKFKEKIMPQLKILDRSWWEKIQQKAICGTPDILGCIQGTFIAIELKRDQDAKISELQRYKLDQIDRAGGIALVVYPENWGNVYRMLIKLSQGGNHGVQTNVQDTK